MDYVDSFSVFRQRQGAWAVTHGGVGNFKRIDNFSLLCVGNNDQVWTRCSNQKVLGQGQLTVKAKTNSNRGRKQRRTTWKLIVFVHMTSHQPITWIVTSGISLFWEDGL
ncbi:hypothetical protein D3C86_1781230 [compost metagenome]